MSTFALLQASVRMSAKAIVRIDSVYPHGRLKPATVAKLAVASVIAILFGAFALRAAMRLVSTATHSLFAMGAEASTRAVAVGWPAFAAAAVGILLIAAGYLRGVRERTPLEWFALVTAVLATVAIMK